MKELAEEKARHQKLLQDYSRLEQRCENLKEDLEAAQHPPQQYVHHVRTDSSEGGESGYGTLSTNQVEDVESVEDDIQVMAADGRWGNFIHSAMTSRVPPLKGQYHHDQSSLSTGHGIGVLV